MQPCCNELDLLDRAVEKHYTFPEDLALARIPDPQGLGSSRYAERSCATKQSTE